MTLLNGLIALLCAGAAIQSISMGQFPAALAYAGFGLGYVGLAWLYIGG